PSGGVHAPRRSARHRPHCNPCADACENPGMEPRATVEIDVVAGAGVIEVVGDDDASMLLLFGDVAGLGGDDSWGSVALLAARAGPDVVRSGEVKALVQWLAEPDLSVDTIDGRCVPPSPDRLGPLLRLLRPGRYVMTAYIPARPPHTVAKGVTHWYDVAETALIPTDSWPPPDRDTVRRYQAHIESGRRFQPALVELSPLPTSPIGYLLDGHHKLAAYQQARRRP